jgi:DNA gyrase subunit A
MAQIVDFPRHPREARARDDESSATRLTAIRDQFGDARRSEIVAQGVDLSMEDLIAPQDMVVTLSHGGYMKAQAVAEYRAQKRGGRGRQATATKEDDFIDHLFIANTHDFILSFSNHGRVYWLKVYNVPQGTRVARGKPIVNLLPLQEGEQITAILPVKEFTDTSSSSWPPRWARSRRRRCPSSRGPRTSGIIAVDLSDGDSLIGAALTDGTHDVMLFSSGRQGRALRRERRPADGTQRARRARHDARPGAARHLDAGRRGRGAVGARRDGERLRQAHARSSSTRATAAARRA